MTEPQPASAAVLARGLGKRFANHWAVARFDLEVMPGEVVLLAGPNGSGKTTLLRLVAGLHRPTAGSLSVFGRDPSREPLACRRDLTVISHDNYLYSPLTARETLRFWARLLGRPSGDAALEELLAEVGLADRADHRVGGFSAGMRKRLTLLRTRLEEPRLVLLDEPLAALDSQGRALMESWIRGFRAAGKAVLVASHAITRMSRLCDRAVLLQQGQLAWSGDAAGLPARMEEIG